MYLAHFGLKEWPFGITPDTDFTYRAPVHEEALSTLLLALDSGEGFVKVTGEVGTGKTLLCRTLLDRLATGDDPAVTAYVPNPRLAPAAMLRALSRELKKRTSRANDEHELYDKLESALLKLAQEGRRVVLCIDEAQALPLDTLEALRLLSNLETGKRKLLQIVLFGQPELDTLLSATECRSLVSRIGFSARMAALNRHELRHYLCHRMAVAGWRGPEAFTPLARWVLWWTSRGVPRAANVLAHKCLMLAYGEGARQATLNHALAARRDAALQVPGWLASLRRLATADIGARP